MHQNNVFHVSQFEVKYENQLVLEINEQFYIKKGEITAFIGRSGSGKTTLLRHIALLLNKATQEITYTRNGVENKYHSNNFFESKEKYDILRKDFSYVDQDYNQNLFGYLSVWENASLKRRIMGRSEEPTRKKCLLEHFFGRDSNDPFYKKKPHELSGGEKQRLAIIQALYAEPTVLFADEPTSANDQTNATKIFELFKELSKEKSILFVSHDYHHVAEYADTVFVLKDQSIEKPICLKTARHTGGTVRDIAGDLVKRL